MSLTCPDGWQKVSMPSTPKGYSTTLPDYSLPFSNVVRTNRKRTGVYKWVKAEGVVAIQGNCSEKANFAGGFTIEKNSSHAINVGGLFNVPFAGEKAEVSGGYEYSWGTATTSGSGLEIEKGPDECWEYMATPVVLQFSICEFWQRSGGPWWEHFGHFIVTKIFRGDPSVFKSPNLLRSFMSCESPIYTRGGLMICKRQCCSE